MPYSILTRTEGDWEYFDVFDDDTHQFMTTAMRLTTSAHSRLFGIVLDPIARFAKMGWDITPGKMKNLVDKYGEDRLYDVIWRFWEVVRMSQYLFDIYLNLVLKYDMFEMPAKHASALVYNQYQSNCSAADLYDKYERILKEDFEEVTDILFDKKYEREKVDFTDILEQHRDKITDTNKDKMKNWLTGQVMKELKGSVDAATVKAGVEKWIETC